MTTLTPKRPTTTALQKLVGDLEAERLSIVTKLSMALACSDDELRRVVKELARDFAKEGGR